MKYTRKKQGETRNSKKKKTIAKFYNKNFICTGNIEKFNETFFVDRNN